jgi:hypothetical protein
MIKEGTLSFEVHKKSLLDNKEWPLTLYILLKRKNKALHG